MNKKNKDRAHKSLIKTVIIVAVISGVLIAVTTLLMIFCPDNDIFSTAVSDGKQMNIPFTIFVEVLATTAGIILGLQIDNYVDEKRGKNNYNELMLRIAKFINNLADGIKDNALITVYDLAQYKMHWDLLLQADAFSVQSLQNNKYYFDLAYVFNFLHFNERYWTMHQDKTISALKGEELTVNKKFLISLADWIHKIENLQKNIQAMIHVENNNIDWLATGKKLVELRVNSKLSEEELAKKFKVSKNMIKKWERTKIKPSIEQLINYSELSGVELFDIIQTH